MKVLGMIVLAIALLISLAGLYIAITGSNVEKDKEDDDITLGIF